MSSDTDATINSADLRSASHGNIDQNTMPHSTECDGLLEGGSPGDTAEACTSIPKPHNESARLAALRRYLILDSPEDDAFKFLAEVAADVCDAPFALVTLVDEDRVWVKSAIGIIPCESPRSHNCCSWVILKEGLVDIPDTTQDGRTASLDIVTGELGIQMYVGANLVTHDGYSIGTLCVLDRRPRQLTDRQKYLLLGLAKQAMALIELRSHERLLTDSMQRLEHIASTDVLTGLLNRRALFERLDIEIERSRRYASPLSLVLIDLDHFKAVNDNHGHQAGDAVLRAIGSLIGTTKRALDIAARYGGEELCILLPQTSIEGAFSFAETLRRNIHDLRIEHSGRTLAVTASLGVASTGIATPDGKQLLALADKAMYAAKRDGRNKVIVA